MKIEKLCDWVYRINDCFQETSLNTFQDMFTFFDYKHITSIKSNKYWKDICDLFVFVTNNDILLENNLNVFFDTLSKVFSKLLKEDFILNKIISFNKFIKGSYLSEHTHSHTFLQWVYYLNDIERGKWGTLFVWDIEIEAKRNSIVIFRWNRKHRVSKYFWKKDRLSLVFWFNKKDNYEKMNKYDQKKRKSMLWY